MSESEIQSNDQNAVAPQRGKFGLPHVVGVLLMNLGIVIAAIKSVNHVKQQPPVPLGFDLTLRTGDGGFIAYGVAAAVSGLILIWIDAQRRKSK